MEGKNLMKILIDTSAWIEYFIGSKRGEIVNNYLNENEVLTSVVSLLELSYKSDRENWNIRDYLNFIKIKSQIKGIKESSIIEFGKLYNNSRKKENSFGFADAILLQTSKDENATILTKDLHFKNFDNVVLI